MIELTDPIWESIGSPARYVVKELQAILEGTGDIRENISILGEDLSHQLSWYNATAYILPHLTALCSKLSKEDTVFLISQIGAAIAAEAHWPLSPGTDIYNEFQEGLEGLRQITKALMLDTEVHDLLKKDEEIGSFFCMAAMSIVGDRKHAYHLWILCNFSWEECPVACSCGWNDEEFSFEKHTDYFIPAKIDIWDKKTLDNEAVWFNGLLELAGDDEIRPVLPFVYGTVICPNCHKQESYWNYQERFENEEY